MKWKRKPGAAVILCSALLLSACGGTEAPASTVPPTSGEAPAISQPAEPEPPASSAVPEPEPPEPASSSVESREEPQPEPGAGMKVPEGCRAEWKLSNGTLILMGYDPGGRTQVQLPTGGSYQIGASCFAGNETLTAVVFPADVTEIGPAAFRACSALKTADFSACRTLVIGNHAFEGAGLAAVSLPEGLTRLGLYAFADCPALTRAEIRGVTLVEEGAFSACGSLQNVFLSREVFRIEENAFALCDRLETAVYEGDTALLKDHSAPGNDALWKAAGPGGEGQQN